jgi:peptidoglycan/xylan/chitin deacetylase (PgdA/CDA1 family)
MQRLINQDNEGFFGDVLKHLIGVLCFMFLASAGCIGENVSLANWPNENKAAAVITFDVEQAKSPDIIRLVDILETNNMGATFFVVAGYYDGVEDVLWPLQKYEVASKGWNQSNWDVSFELQLESIERSQKWFTSHGFDHIGFRAPFLMDNEETYKALSESGYVYSSSNTGLLPSRQGDVIELPLSVAYDPFWNEEVEDFLPLFYLSFENTYDEDGLFIFYTLPEHADENLDVFLKHLGQKDVWIASGREVVGWWVKREGLSLNIDGDTAIVTNNGAASVSGASLKKDEDYIALGEIKPGESVRVEI